MRLSNVFVLIARIYSNDGVYAHTKKLRHFFSPEVNFEILTLKKATPIEKDLPVRELSYASILLKLLFAKPSLVFLQSGSLLPIIGPLCVLKRHRIYCFFHASHRGSRARRRVRFLRYFLFGKIICFASDQKKRFQEFGIAEKNLLIIPHSLSKINFQQATIPTKVAPLKIITLARIHSDKGHEISLKALHKLKKEGVLFTLKILGNGTTEDTRYLEKVIADLGLQQEVELVGHVNPGPYLQNSEIMLLASSHEVFPISCIEGMASGLVLVRTRVGGATDQVIEGDNGELFEVGDVDHLYKILKELAHDRERLSRMAKRSRELFEERFEDSLHHKKYLELLES